MRHPAYLFLCVFSALTASACDVDIEIEATRYILKTPGVFVSKELSAQMQTIYETIAVEYSSDVLLEDLRIVFVPSPDIASGSWDGQTAFVAPNSIEVVVPSYNEYWFTNALRDFFESYDSSSPPDSWAPGAFEVSDSLVERLAVLFKETRACAKNLPHGRFQDLSVYLKPFAFLRDGEYLRGYFSLPNAILLGGDSFTFAHEVIHYLLFVNTGDADGKHASPFFSQCSEPTDS